MLDEKDISDLPTGLNFLSFFKKDSNPRFFFVSPVSGMYAIE